MEKIRYIIYHVTLLENSHWSHMIDTLSIAGYDNPSSCGSKSGESGGTEGASVGV